MDKSDNYVQIKEAYRSLTDAIKRSSEIVYLIVLSLFIAGALCTEIMWAPFPGITDALIRSYFNFAVIILFGIDLASIIMDWIQRKWAAIPAFLLAAFFVLGCSRLLVDKFELLMSFFLIILSYGKDYRKILKVYLVTVLVALTVAGVGTWFGLTVEYPMMGVHGIFYSFGTINPNDWSYLIFLALIIIWYLYLQERYLYTFSLFWLTAAFLSTATQCRTISALLVLFPIMELLVHKGSGSWVILKYLLTAVPFLCFFLTLFLGSRTEFMEKYVLHGSLRNWGLRFTNGWIGIQVYGFTLFGKRIGIDPGNQSSIAHGNVLGHAMDNGYSTYVVERGVIWMALCLIWLAYANWKAIKKKDYEILLVALCMSIFSLMERPGLDMWYNFIFLYPLALCVSQKEKEKNRNQINIISH